MQFSFLDKIVNTPSGKGITFNTTTMWFITSPKTLASLRQSTVICRKEFLVDNMYGAISASRFHVEHIPKTYGYILSVLCLNRDGF